MTGTLDRIAQLVSAEALGELRCPRARVLFVLLLYGGSSGQACPSVATIARLTQTDLRRVRRALRELEDAGMIRAIGMRSRGGRGRATTYEVAPGARDGMYVAVAQTGDEATRVSETETGVEATRVSGVDTRVGDTRVGSEKPGSLSTETRVAEYPNPGRSDPPNHRTKRTIEPTGVAETRVDLAAQSDALRRLAEIGITFSGANPFRVRIFLQQAFEEGLDLDGVEALGRAALGGDNPPGLLLSWLEHVSRWRARLAQVGERPKKASTG